MGEVTRAATRPVWESLQTRDLPDGDTCKLMLMLGLILANSNEFSTAIREVGQVYTGAVQTLSGVAAPEMGEVAGAATRPAWEALQTRDLPDGSYCKSVANERQQNVWHAWSHRGQYCDYHHLGGLKATVARVVKNRLNRVRIL